MNLISERENRKKLGGPSRTSLWELRKTDPDFPKPVMLGRRLAWVEEEMDAYIAALIAARDGKGPEV